MTTKIKVPNWVDPDNAELLGETFDIIHGHTSNMITAAEILGVTEKAFVSMFAGYALSYAKMAFADDERGLQLLRDILEGDVSIFNSKNQKAKH